MSACVESWYLRRRHSNCLAMLDLWESGQVGKWADLTQK